MDTVEQMKSEVTAAKATWRENGRRLIWLGVDADGSLTFRNTTSAIKQGPKISEAEAARFLADEGPWHHPA